MVVLKEERVQRVVRGWEKVAGWVAGMRKPSSNVASSQRVGVRGGGAAQEVTGCRGKGSDGTD